MFFITLFSFGAIVLARSFLLLFLRVVFDELLSLPILSLPVDAARTLSRLYARKFIIISSCRGVLSYFTNKGPTTPSAALSDILVSSSIPMTSFAFSCGVVSYLKFFLDCCTYFYRAMIKSR